MRTRLLLALGCVAVLACGGKTLGSGDGTDGGNATHDASSSGSDVAASADSPFVQPDTSFFEDASVPPGIVCNQGPGSGSGGGGSCEINLDETCSDGTTYQVSCQCSPGNTTGTCSCSEMSGMSGGSGGGGGFPGCPVCPTPEQAWDFCGFPH
jgi:hypothetical protein